METERVITLVDIVHEEYLENKPKQHDLDFWIVEVWIRGKWVEEDRFDTFAEATRTADTLRNKYEMRNRVSYAGA